MTHIDTPKQQDSAQPEPACPLAMLWRSALVWLLDDLSDAGENRHPEADEEYDSVAYARRALAATCTHQDVDCQPIATMAAKADLLEDAVLAAIPYVRYGYNQTQDPNELDDLNLCRAAIGLAPFREPGQEEEQS